MRAGTCLACHAPTKVEVDFGPQAAMNRFLAPGEAVEEGPLALAQCGSCALLQVAQPAAVDFIRPRFDWIQYNEPEPHLDAVAALVADVAPRGASVLGVTSKDDSLVARLERLGLHQPWRIRPAEDLGLGKEPWGLESLQARLTTRTSASLAASRGAADVVLARHVVEHAQDPVTFLNALGNLVSPGGRLVLEVPDAAAAMERCGMLQAWEEHTVYFSEATLRSTLARAGFGGVQLLRYPYPLEDSLVALAQRGVSSPPSPPDKTERGRGPALAALDRRLRAAWREVLTYEAAAGPVALLGANHFAVAFLNLLGLAPFVDFVVDDHPAKQRLSMPGSRMPILPSGALLDKHVRLCLVAVNPAFQAGIAAKHPAFLEAGGRFQSIFDTLRGLGRST